MNVCSYANVGTIIKWIIKAGILKFMNDPSYGFFGVILNMHHVCGNCIHAIMFGNTAEFLYSFFVGSDLSFKVGNILFWISRWKL